MIKNLILKKSLKKTVFPVLSLVNKFWPKDDKIILLYCANKGIEYCNLTLRTYLLKYNYDKKYKIYCGIKSLKYSEDIPRVTFVSGIKAILCFFKAKHVFYTVGQIPIKPSKDQCVIHMQHGCADYKRMAKSAQLGNGDEFYFTYMTASSTLYIKPYMEAYSCDEKNITIVGDVMCDELLTAARNVYDFGTFRKMLLWLPTFRQSKEMGHDDSHMETLVPLFNEEEYSELNTYLAKYNILMIVKLHPVQTTPIGMQRHFSHLSVYSHKEFMESKYDMYTLMANSDGLLGDYSSASMQYLLLDRPMAYVVPDLEDYGKTRGFVFENPEDYMGGHIIKTQAQFYAFIEDFANDKDIYKDKRHWVCSQVFKYHDANSCKRVVDLSGLSLD